MKTEAIELATEAIRQAEHDNPVSDVHKVKTDNYLIIGNNHLIHLTRLDTLESCCFLPRTGQILPMEVLIYKEVLDAADEELKNYLPF